MNAPKSRRVAAAKVSGAKAAPGLRPTRQRAAVFRALSSADGFLTAQEIHAELSRAGARVGLTTVYRTLQALAEGGELDVLRNSDGEALYRRCDSEDHHHHLVCRICGSSVEIENPDIERWADRTARLSGFVEVTHTVELYGICGSCAGGR